MPEDSLEGYQPPTGNETDDEITTQARPASSIDALKKRMENAKPVDLDSLLGKDRPTKSGAKFSDTGEILSQPPPTPDSEKPQGQ